MSGSITVRSQMRYDKSIKNSPFRLTGNSLSAAQKG